MTYAKGGPIPGFTRTELPIPGHCLASVVEPQFARGRDALAALNYRTPKADTMARHPGTQHVLDLFGYEHLPEHLQAVSKPISDVAHHLADALSDGPELTVGLRKLLEAKDALVRQAVLDAKAAI